MGLRPSGWVARRLRHRALRAWSQLSDDLDGVSSADLRKLRDEARSLRGVLRRFLRQTAPAVSWGGAALASVPLPPATEWRWRPQVFSTGTHRIGFAAPSPNTRLGDELAIWHDCPNAALILRQTTWKSPAVTAPFGLRIEVMQFEGSYLSMSIDLPASARQGLDANHILRLDTSVLAERAQDMQCRLNFNYGPNTDQMVTDLRGVTVGQLANCSAEFDLSQSEMNVSQLSHMWIDVLIPAPSMNRFDFGEFIVSRHPRADL